MEFKKSMIIIVLAIFLLSIAGVCAGDVNDNLRASEECVETELSQNNWISITDDSQVIGQYNNEEKLTAGNIWYVNSSAANGAGTLENPFNNLKDTVDASGDNDIIKIASGTYAGENNTHLIINKNLTFERYGDGDAIFDGENTLGIWEIQAKSINITGLTFQNGYGGNGGALSFKSELINSNINADFNNNQAMSSGGAIHFSKALTNVNITGNFTKNNAHGYSYDGEGGGAICFLGELNRVNIIGDFTNNIAQSFAGANYFKSNIANVNIYGNYKNNSAVEQNGGANWFMALENVVITGNFTNNNALGFGGANVFYEELKNVNITGNFINNTATWNNGGANQFKEKLTNVSITGDYSYNKAKQNGGANWFGDNKALDNVNITGNYDHNEAGQDGGANRLGKPVNVNIIGNYTSNSAKNTGSWQGGGAIYVQNNPTKITIAANFYNNVAVSQGAAICFYNSIINADITGNFINNTGKSVIYNYGASNSVIHDSIFLNNSKITCDGSGTIKIVDTWFGNNATNYNTAPQSGVNFENWLFLNATVDSNDSDASKISNIIFKLYSYIDSGVSDYDNNLLNPINLTITATNGNVSKNIAELGESIQFTPTKGGTDTVTAAVENTRHTVEIDVKGDFDLLQDLVNNESLSLINLERNYTYNDFDTMTEGVRVTRSIIVNGNGYTIDAKGKSRIFNIEADNVVIENLTLENANFNGDGGAIWFTSNGNVTNCNFTNNKATGDGGAVYFRDDGNVTNCNFTNNTAKSTYYGGGAIYFESTGAVENCNFANNTASNSGGAILMSSGTVTNCNFTNNSARYVGAIKFGTGTVENCNFINNTASNNGGAIWMDSGTVENCNFSNNTASNNGGAIWMDSGTVENCNFINNKATGEYSEGGAIWIYSGTVTNCNFINNKATAEDCWGGAIYMYSGTVTNCNFINNTASDYGGAIRMYSGTVINCNFVNNTASKYDGGAVYFRGSGAVENCNFTNNSAKYGGAVHFWDTGYVTNCNFTNNQATDDGGAVYFYNNGEVTNCNFTNNHATGDFGEGGAIYFNGDGNVTKCIFINNTAKSSSMGGGAVYFDEQGAVENCNFTNNNASENGGAVYFAENSIGSVTNCNFTNNAASEDGGTVYFAENSIGSVTNCNFTNNAASEDGGAIWMYSGSVTNCNFTNNQAKRWGGAIYFNSNSNGKVTNCNFTNNHATGGRSCGGAICFEGHSTGELRNCNFTNNTASYGGAINMYSGTVENCNFTNNTASYGGAINMYSGTVENCNFTNNNAGDLGGAILFDITGTVTNCNFTGNNATTGSAIYFYSTSATKTVSNSIFLNNRANAEALDVVKNDNNITITFTGKNNLLNAIYSRNDAEVTFTNVTYWGANGIANTGSSATTPSRSNKATGQNITVGVVVNGNLVLSDVMVTDENGAIVLNINAGDNYYITACHYTDSYYTEAEKTISNNTKFNVNVTSQTTTNKTVNITAKSNIFNECMPGKLLFILPNNVEINATYASNGTWWAVHTFDDYADYQVNASYIGLDNVTITNATISIVKANSTVNVSDVVLTYGESKNVTVTTTGATGITAKINNTPVDVIDNFTIPISGLAAGNYTLTVTTIADDDHNPVTKTVNITVNKAGTKITLTNETLYLKAGDIVSDLANLTPADAGNLTFQSSNEEIAIAADGTIYARVKGNVTVTVSFAGNDNYTAAENKTITVYVALKDASVSVENETLNLNVNEKYEFNPAVNPSFLATYYSSSNESVATVTEYGLLRAVGEGTAIITLTVGNDQTYAINTTNVTVTVSFNDASVSVNNSTLDLFVGDSFAVVAITSPVGLNVTFVPDDSGVYSVDDNGVVTALKEGAGSILVKVGGDGVYAENSTTVNVTVSKIPTEILIQNDTVELKVNDIFDPVVSLIPSGAGRTGFKSSNASVALVNGDGEITAIGEGNAIITAYFTGNEKYAACESKNITVTVSFNDASVSVNNSTLDLFVGDSFAVVAITSPVGLNVTFVPDDSGVYSVDDNGVVTALKEGAGSILVKVGGDGVYAENSTTVNVTVSKIPTEISLANTTVDLKVLDEIATGATLTPAEAGNLTYKSSDDSVAKVENDQIIAVGEGSANISVLFEGNAKYLASNTTINVNVSKKDYVISINTFDINVTDVNAIVAIIELPGDARGNVSVSINDDDFVVEINETTVNGINGALLMPIYNKAYPAGEYNISATYGSNVYDESGAKGTFTISKLSITPEITVNDSDVIVKVPADASDNVTLTVGNETLITPIDNGTAEFSISDLPAGDYNATLTYLGDDKYLGFEEIVPISIEKQTQVEFENLTKYYHGPERFTVKVTDSKGNPDANKSVQITINGVTYTKVTDENGTASLAINLNSGEYYTEITVNNETFNTTVTILPSVNGTELEKVFGNDEAYYATFCDSEGNYLKEGTEVKFNINGVEYARNITGNEGLAKLNINLEQGNYVITALNPVTGEMASNNITIIPKIIENNDIIKYYRNATQYTVKVIGEDKNPVGANKTVKFNINGVFYERQTNESGIAKLNINLQPGEYIITAEYEGCMVSNNITVLQVLSAENMTKKEGSDEQFVATLVDGTGSPYAGQTVTFNINGVFYNKTTDLNGQAKLNINLMAGEYIITSSYNEANIANKITVSS